jgi:hypothetical protein
LQKFLNSEIGHTRSVLIEKDGTGHTEHFVRVSGIEGEVGEIVRSSLGQLLFDAKSNCPKGLKAVQ